MSEFPPCVGCGFCCRRAVCAFGVWDDDAEQCAYLESWPDNELSVPRYVCGQYEHIRWQPFSDFSPAFGAGCCQNLFNDDRAAVLAAGGNPCPPTR